METLSLNTLLDRFANANASDLYLTVGTPAAIRVLDKLTPISPAPLSEDDVRSLLSELLEEHVIEEFESTLEYNTAIYWQDRIRLRVNVFRQRQKTGIVMRRINTTIPSFKELGLSDAYAKLAMEKRGLVLVAGQTGSGKSTSMASMVDFRNQNSSGHIVTIEDPIEFVHEHKRCIITQRDVGIDTYSFGIALKNVLRQRPDVIVIGEIRDREAMEHALTFSETGHLCIATIHANNSNQAVERVISFFPEEKHHQVLLSLALNLRGILSQRLIPTVKGERTLAIEVMLNEGLIKNLIQEEKIKELKEIIERSRDQGMQSFDQHLLDHFIAGTISENVALAESDNPANLRLQITQRDMARRMRMTLSNSPESRKEF